MTWLQQAGALVLENYIMDIHKYYLLVGPFNTGFLKARNLGWVHSAVGHLRLLKIQ